MPFIDDKNIDENPAFKEAVSSEKIKAYYALTSYSVIGNLLNGLIFAAIMSIKIGIVINSIWFLSNALIILYRIFIKRKFEKEKMFHSNRYWLIFAYSGVILNSICWGMIPVFLFPETGIEYQMFVVFVIAGMSAGSLASLTVKKSFFVIYTASLIFPLCLRFLVLNTLISYAIAIICCTFFLMLLVSAVRQSRVIEDGFKTKIKFETARNELRISETRFSAIFNEAPIGIFYYNSEYLIIECNEYFASILKSAKEKLIGLNLLTLKDMRLMPAISSVFNGTIGKYEGEYHTKLSDSVLWIGLQTAPIYDKIGNITGGVGIVEDLTEKHKVEEKIEYQAYHDSLTQLPNRDLLLDRLKMAVKQSRRHDHKGALLFLDLNRFKTINDTLGHQIGDVLLKKVAGRLFSVIREEDTVARIGGDEFVVLLPELSNDTHHAVSFTKMVADKIHEALITPFDIEGNVIHTSTSIGASIFPHQDESFIEVLKHADMAMYKAKEEGSSSTHFYDSAMDEYLKKSLLLEKDLKQAIINNEFILFYQPVVEIKSGLIRGAEILIRWNHPAMGLVFPDDFIEIAEDTGLIVQIGNLVLEKAVETINSWTEHPFDKIDHIGINLSVKQFRQTMFVKQVRDLLDKNPKTAGKIIFELTESILIDDFQKTLLKINEIRESGAMFAIDDFGTGYSSLSYLKKLPIDVLKIDRSFIKDVLIDEDDAAIARTMIDIADHFNLKIIAEGVETAEHVQFLDKLDCQFYQGYFCSKPVQLEEFTELVLKNYNALIQ